MVQRYQLVEQCWLAVLGSPIYTYSLDWYIHTAVMRPHFHLGHWLRRREHVVCPGGLISIAGIVGGGGWLGRWCAGLWYSGQPASTGLTMEGIGSIRGIWSIRD